MEFPCEFIVRNILPAFKAYLVKDLSSRYKFSQAKISKLLDITQASVSYYLRGERGDVGFRLIQENDKIRNKLSSIAETIAKNELKPEGFLDDICQLCSLIQEAFPDLRHCIKNGTRI